MAEFQLSTLDRNAPRAYLRCALCFACQNDESNIITQRLQRAAKSLVSEIPMLAGVVNTDDQQKPINVTVTPKDVEEFEATIKHSKGYAQSYQDINHDGFAPRQIEGIDLTPLANRTEDDHNPSCAIQANFIDNGLILTIYLHHAVADINGVSTILRLMSEGLPPRKLDYDDLESEATVVSQARARLSNGHGAPAFLSLARDINQQLEQSRQQQQQHLHPDHGDGIATATIADNDEEEERSTPSNRSAIFTFRLDTLAQTTEMLNSRRILRNPNSTEPLSPREVLISIL